MTKTQQEQRRAEYEARRAERGDVDAYRNLKKGDVVKIRGERGVFTFVEARVVEGECQWVGVYGGTSSHRAMRFFTLDRVIKKRTKVGA